MSSEKKKHSLKNRNTDKTKRHMKKHNTQIHPATPHLTNYNNQSHTWHIKCENRPSLKENYPKEKKNESKHKSQTEAGEQGKKSEQTTYHWIGNAISRPKTQIVKTNNQPDKSKYDRKNHQLDTSPSPTHNETTNIMKKQLNRNKANRIPKSH